jgi:hypothetical protein
MLGKRSSQRGLLEADHLYLRFVGEDSFYGFLARQRGQLFRDEDFAGLPQVSRQWTPQRAAQSAGDGVVAADARRCIR